MRHTVDTRDSLWSIDWADAEQRTGSRLLQAALFDTVNKSPGDLPNHMRHAMPV